MNPHELEKAIKSFTPCQIKVFNYIKTYYKKENDDLLRLFISGPGGVGKSFLINAIISYLQLYHPVIQSTSPVLVCAPTGTAAKNVKGSTIHHLLKIPVQQYLKYEPIANPVTLKRLKDEFNGVHTLIIDEISMVSSTMISIINNR